MIIYKKEVEVEMKEILMYTTGICFLVMFGGGLLTAMVVFLEISDDSISALARFFAKLTMVSVAASFLSLFLLTVFR
jgi:hypothetical protein